MLLGQLDPTFSVFGVTFRHPICTLDWRDTDPEPSVIRSVLGVAIDLLLDPLDRRLIGCCWVSRESNTVDNISHTVDVHSVRGGQTRSSTAMLREPPVVAIVVLAIPS